MHKILKFCQAIQSNNYVAFNAHMKGFASDLNAMINELNLEGEFFVVFFVVCRSYQ